MILRITLYLLCAAVLTGCGGSGTDAVPNAGGLNPAPQLPSVTAFRDCAALRITDLVGLLDRLEAILTGADSPSVLQALGITLTPVAGSPNTFDYQASFDLDADGVDDSFSGSIAFSDDPAQLGPGSTAQVTWDYAGGTGDVSGSGELVLTLTTDGATASGMGTFLSNDGCEFEFMIPASDPIPIRFPATTAAPQRNDPSLEVEALKLGGVVIAGSIEVSITIGAQTFIGVFTLRDDSNVVDFRGTIDGQRVLNGQVLVFGPGVRQQQIMGLIDAAVLKIGIMGMILEKSFQIAAKLRDSTALPPDVTLGPPNPDFSYPYTWVLNPIPTNISVVGTATNVEVKGDIRLDNQGSDRMDWTLTSDANVITGSNTTGIPLLFDIAGNVFNADGAITIRNPANQDRVCVLLFSNANLTFTSGGGVKGTVTRFAIFFPGANQSSAADDSVFSAELEFDGAKVKVKILSVRVDGKNAMLDPVTGALLFDREFELTLN